MKRLMIVFLCVVWGMKATAQLTLEACTDRVMKHYPLIKQYDLTKQVEAYSLSNIEKVYWPQISMSAKATLQSEAIDISLPLPPTPIEIKQSKDQYQITLDINQTVWDGGLTASKKKIVRGNSAIEKKQLDVELYKLRDQVNQLFFSLLFYNEQSKQLDLLEQELAQNRQVLKSNLKQGTIGQHDLNLFDVEKLEVQQQRIELKSSQEKIRTALSVLMGEEMTSSTMLMKPLIAKSSPAQFDQRPEIQLIAQQIQLIELQKEVEKEGFNPKIGLFVQGGYGRPGLNFMNNTFQPYYIGGVRMNWNISHLYTTKNNLNTLQSNQLKLESLKETWVLNNNIQLKKLHIEEKALLEKMKTDEEMIRLKTEIKQACASKVANGMATTTDLLKEIHAESMARLQKELHELQLLLNQENIKYVTNQTHSTR